jgi:hypothetical protein
MKGAAAYGAAVLFFESRAETEALRRVSGQPGRYGHDLREITDGEDFLHQQAGDRASRRWRPRPRVRRNTARRINMAMSITPTTARTPATTSPTATKKSKSRRRASIGVVNTAHRSAPSPCRAMSASMISI